MFGICNNLGLAARPVLSGRRGPRLRGVAVSQTTGGASQRLHRDQRRLASRTWTAGIPRTSASSPPRRIPASSSFRNTISLDQYIAERIGTLTRFPSLTLARQWRGPQPFVDGHRCRHPAGRARVRGFQPAFPARHARAGRGADPPARHRTQHPRRRRRPGEGARNAMSARATAAGSSSTSRASATSSTACRSRASGSANPSRS